MVESSGMTNLSDSESETLAGMSCPILSTSKTSTALISLPEYTMTQGS